MKDLPRSTSQSPVPPSAWCAADSPEPAAPSRAVWRRQLAWLPIPVLLATMVMLEFVGPRAAYESQPLLVTLNFIFSTVASLLVVALIARSFLWRSTPGLLALGCGVLLWGAAGTIGPLLLGHGANATISVHNILVGLSALCHLTGAALSLKPGRVVPRARLALAAAYALSVGVVGLVVVAALTGWLPTFFVPEQGGTAVRQVVLSAAILMFVGAVALLWQANRREATPFVRWYGMALLFVATGLLGVMLQSVTGDALNWTGRAAQFLGGAYMLVAAVASVRETGTWRISLDAAAWDDRLLRLLTPHHHWSWPWGWRYGLAVAIAVLATVLRWATLPWIGAEAPYNVALLAIVLATILLGIGPSLLCMLLANVAVEVFIVGSFAPGPDGETIARMAFSMAIGALVVCILHSARVARLKFEKSEARLSHAQQIADLGRWEWDITTGALIWSEQIYRQMGEEPGAFTPNYDTFLQYIHPEDRVAYESAIQGVLAGMGRYDLELRIVRSSGAVRVLHTRGEVVNGPDGKPQRMIGVCLDITERKRAEEALRQSEERMRRIAQAGRIGFVEWNAAKDTGYWSPEHYELFGFEPGSPVSWDRWLRGVHPDDRERVVANGARLLDRGRAEGQVRGHKDEYRFIRPDGSVIWLEGDMSLDMTAGEPVIRGSVRDITERKQAEESEERLRTLMNHNPSLVFLKDETGRYVYLNEGYEKQFVLSKDWYGKTDFDFWPKQSAELFLAHDAEVLRSGKIQQFLEDSTDLEGKRYCWLCYKFPFTDSHNRRYVGGIGIDVTARVLAEEALRESEQRYRLLFDRNPDGVFAVDASGRFILANPACELLSGYSAAELLQKTFMELVAPDQLANTAAEFERSLREQAYSEVETALIRKDGRRVEVWVAGEPSVTDGHFVVHCTAKDITERKQAEAELRESRARLAWVLENTGIGTWFNTLPLGHLNWDDQTRRLFFVPPGAEPTVELFWSRVHRDDRKPTRLAVEKAIREGTLYEIDHRAVNPDTGEVRWIHSVGQATYAADGTPTRFDGINHDITERKRTEKTLRQSEARYRMLHESMRDAFVQVDMDGRIIECNDLYCQMLGYSRQEVRELSYQAVTPERWHEYEERIVREQIVARGYSDVYEKEYRRKDGTVFPVELRTILSRDTEGRPVAMWGLVRDIAERKRTEETLRQAHERLRRFVDSDIVGVVIADATGAVLETNDYYLRLIGFTREEFNQGKVDWRAITPPEWRAADEQALAELRARGTCSPFEKQYVRRDGSRVSVFIADALLPGPQEEIASFVLDVTQRKQTEEALRQAKITAEAANEAKSQFLANMSHELRTPMNAILGMIDVALPKAMEPIVQDCLQTAKGSADLLLTLLNDLLDSAKIESGKLELESAPFSLRRMLDQITRVLAVRASEKGLSFCCRMPDETPDALVGDRMRLQQVLLNLASNAIKFTERGDVEIELSALMRDSEVCLEFAVRDTGIGIPPSGQERLFRPFGQADASMSRRFGGTGLGLSICKSLVELMGGQIWVQSEVGVGSTFYFAVVLPLAMELPADFDAPVDLPTAACGQLRVLLVEDNAANQKLATYILQDRGHVVEIAGDGQEALCLTEQNRYDVILMDVQMPGLNGLEATAAIRKRENSGSRVPIIAMTAHAMKGDRERCLAAGMDGYLSKPVNAMEMIGLVESLAQGVVPSAATPNLAESSFQATGIVFNPDVALTRCFNSRSTVREMILGFYDEVANLFPQMHAALANGDLVEVGRLGHRIKGTVVYLGAEPAKEAALRVERFCKSSGGTPSEAEEAINALEHECLALRAALVTHPLAIESKHDKSDV